MIDLNNPTKFQVALSHYGCAAAGLLSFDPQVEFDEVDRQFKVLAAALQSAVTLLVSICQHNGHDVPEYLSDLASTVYPQFESTHTDSSGLDIQNAIALLG
jgi:hypothetical protein